ncbi:MAG: sugar phosphate isomerase/epimerase [Pirellulales bacterium]|nr:sugar phosphate isomerase/epimerase [Pirellulales bacterium]
MKKARTVRLQENENPTRRRFLQTAGFGAAAALAVAGRSFEPHRAAAQAAAATGDSSRKIPFVLGLASYTLRKFSLDETLAMTRRVGLTHICLKSFHLPLDTPPAQIAAAAEKVRQAGLTLYGGGVIGMKDEDEVNQAFEYARAAGMNTIVGVPAPDVLPLVNGKVQEFDIAVAIHNHGPGDKVYPTPESAYEKIKDLDKRIGLCIDIGHTLRTGADPIRDAERFADRLLDIHLKDIHEAAPGGRAIEVGRGVIDIPRFLATLVEIGYSRVAAFEYEKDADDPLAGLAESVGYVKGVLAAS